MIATDYIFGKKEVGTGPGVSQWEEVIDFAIANNRPIPTGAEYDRLANIVAQLVETEIWDELDVFTYFNTSAPKEFRLIDWKRKFIMAEVNSPIYTDTGVEANAAGTAYILTGYTPSINAVNFQPNSLTIGFKSMQALPVNNSGIIGGRTGNNSSQIAFFNDFARPMEPVGHRIPYDTGYLYEFKVKPDTSSEGYVNGEQFTAISGRSGDMCQAEQTILRCNGLYTAKPGCKLGAVYYGSPYIDPLIMNSII